MEMLRPIERETFELVYQYSLSWLFTSTRLSWLFTIPTPLEFPIPLDGAIPLLKRRLLHVSDLLLIEWLVNGK